MFNNPFFNNNTGNSGFDPIFNFREIIEKYNAAFSNPFGNTVSQSPFGFTNPGDMFQNASAPFLQISQMFNSVNAAGREFSELFNQEQDASSEEFLLLYGKKLEKFSRTLFSLITQSSGMDRYKQFTDQVRATASFAKQANNPFSSMLNIPGFGPNADQWEKIKTIVALSEEYGEAYEKLTSLFETMGDKVDETFKDDCKKKETGAKTNAMEYFDIWVGAFEKEYKRIVNSAIFSERYGDFTNATIKIRAFFQEFIDDSAELAGLPSKRSTDTMLRHISTLRKENRKLKSCVAEIQTKLGASKTTSVNQVGAADRKSPIDRAETEKKSASQTPAKRKKAANKTNKA